jgi:hypothetical protein
VIEAKIGRVHMKFALNCGENWRGIAPGRILLSRALGTIVLSGRAKRRNWSPYRGDNVGKVALDNDKEVRGVVEQIQRAGQERRISSAAGLERVMSAQQELGQQLGMER